MRHITRTAVSALMLAAASATAVSALTGAPALADPPPNGSNVTAGMANCGTAGTFTFIATGNSG